MAIIINSQGGTIITNHDIHDNQVVNIASGNPQVNSSAPLVPPNFGNIIIVPAPALASALSAAAVPVLAPVASPDAPSPFESCIPEYLRSGLLLVAWNNLRDAGLLTADYQLAPSVSKAAARFMVTCFCQKKKKNTWVPFEHFWNLTDLKRADHAFSKEHEDKISAIFRNL